MAEIKRKKLQGTLEQLLAYKGMMPLRLLQQAIGVLGWASSILMAARPWLSTLCAAATQHQRVEPIRRRAREREREKRSLVFVRQVENALRSLHALVQEIDALRPGLSRTFKWRPDAPKIPKILIQTDVRPTGIGGFLMIGSRFVPYSQQPRALFGAAKAEVVQPKWRFQWPTG